MEGEEGGLLERLQEDENIQFGPKRETEGGARHVDLQ